MYFGEGQDRDVYHLLCKSMDWFLYIPEQPLRGMQLQEKEAQKD